MKSFLLREKKPIIKWGMLPDNTFFEGTVPDGFYLAVSPWGYEGYVVVDVDRHGDIDGFENVPKGIMKELEKSLNYNTKNNGKHYWLKYTGFKSLVNKASGLGIDLRTNKGYVVWYPKEDIRDVKHTIRETNTILNEWLEELFCNKPIIKKEKNERKNLVRDKL